MSNFIDGQSLRSLRQARGWDQKTLARKAGVNPSVVSRVERGLQDNLKVSVLVAIAKTLDTPVDALLVTYRQAVPSEPVQELAVALSEVTALSAEHQRFMAALLRGGIAALREQGIDRSH